MNYACGLLLISYNVPPCCLQELENTRILQFSYNLFESKHEKVNNYSIKIGNA